MTKQCSQCKIEKDYSEFHKKVTSPDKYQYECKACHLIMNREWRKNNPDKYKIITERSNNNLEKRSRKRIKQAIDRKNLTDTYIRNLLTMKNNLSARDITDEMIEIHRINLKLKRELELTPKLKNYE